MKILQIHTHYRERGGEDTVVAAEADLLRSAGHTVIQWQARNPSDPFRTVASLSLAPWNPLAARLLESVAERERPDVAHIHNTWWALSPSVVRVLNELDIPIVMTLHNYRLMCVNAQLYRDGAPCEDCVGTHPWRGVRYRCYRDSGLASAISAASIALNRRVGTWEGVSLFLALTEFARALFIEGGLPPDRIVVKPNFVDDPGTRDLAPSASRTVLHVGRITTEKGVALLLDAWSRANMDDLELVLVGDGPLKETLAERAPSGVSFLGAQPPSEVRRLMLNARALVFPSMLYEGQPMVLLEAMAAGLPMIVSQLGGIPQTVSGAAALVPILGDRAWVSAMSHLLDDRWIDECGTAARKLFEGRYAPGIGLARLTKEYSEATAHRRGKTS